MLKNKDSELISADDVFEYVCYRCALLKHLRFLGYEYTVRVTVPEIATHFKVLRPVVRKRIEQLKRKGYIESVCESAYDICLGRNVLMRGFRVTKNGEKTDVYQEQRSLAET